MSSVRLRQAALRLAPSPRACLAPGLALLAAINVARADFQAARYRELATALPGLIGTATVTRQTAGGDDLATAAALLAGAYLVASELAVKVNDDVLAWALADRAVNAAEHCDDPLVLAEARRRVAVVLRRTGHAGAARTLLLTAAAAIEPAGPSSPDHLSVYGTLLATAAYTAAVDGDRSTAHDLIGESASAARRLGHDGNYRGTAFGPTNVILYKISIAQSLGDSGAAVDLARTVRVAAIPAPERQGRYWIDLARAYHQWGKHPQCYRALLAAEQAAPDDVRYRPPVHRMVDDLLSADRRHALPGLPEFARRAGLHS